MAGERGGNGQSGGQKGSLWSWFLVGLLLTPLAVLVWGVSHNDWRFAVGGGGFFAILMAFFVIRGRRLPRDPQQQARIAAARTAAEARANLGLKRRLRGQLMGAGIAILVVMLNALWRKHAAQISHLSAGQLLALCAIAAGILFAAIQFFLQARKKRNAP